ncbi:type II toxin-antitoxin system RelE/ParE family toxin [Achromobacter marplatensis]|uniref:type II toxin-antitoxin system RelE/ParE family toxin n=1 Tax=Achromobacter marplatensis TaxID=470868 RepID=UPI0028F0BB2C|nr:type II toxin-antitoxin system RelE/ParE family toxin [Achromobacter marplatensis]
MKVEWSALAMEDRDRISESPKAAIQVDIRIEEQVDQLVQFPELGRLGRIEDTRELVISQTSYVVPYRVYGNVVRILRMLHCAQQWPDELSG